MALDRGNDYAAGSAEVGSTPLDAGRFAPADLDRAVLQKEARLVRFARVDDLLALIWEGEITFEQWLRLGVEFEFVDGPRPEPAALESVYRSWQHWQARRRRRRAVAGLLLSVSLLLAAFVLIVTLRAQL